MARSTRLAYLWATIGAALAVGILASALTGCGETYEQKVMGYVTEGGRPAAYLPVRFLASGDTETCDLPGAETRTDQMGVFKISQPYRRSALENFVVAIHPYRVCVQRNDQWTRVWSVTTGPAPRKLDLECRLGDTVECRASWNGQPYGRWERPRVDRKIVLHSGPGDVNSRWAWTYEGPSIHHRNGGPSPDSE